MKRTLVFLVFVLFLCCLSSCRSTSKSCGLAENELEPSKTEKQIQQQHIEFVA